MNIPEEKQKYVEIIRKLIPVNELPQEVQNEIIRKGELIKLKKNKKAFKQGGRDNYSYYLLAGEIQLEANKQVHNSITGSSDRSHYPMAQLQPRQFTGVAKIDSVVLRLDRDYLDKLLVMHQGKNEADDGFGDGLGSIEVDVIDSDEEEDLDWMSRMLQSELFSNMPMSNIHQLFALLEPVEYKAGDNVINQDETGHHYYIVQEGRCEVLRQSKPGMKETRLAELKGGDGFGEEALIAETKRNATIKMLTDGVVAQLSKDNFVTLIQNAAIKAVSVEKATEIVKQGGKWLDVRFKNEHEQSTIEGSIHIPLNILRTQSEQLDPNVHYIAFCDTGGRSSTASFLLTGSGFTVSYLDKGLVNHPELAPPEDVTDVPKVPEPVKEPVVEPEQKASPPAKTKPKTEKPAVKSEPQSEAVTEKSSAKPKPKTEKPAVKSEPQSELVTEKAPEKPKPKTEKPAIKSELQLETAAEKAPAKPDEEIDPEILATVLDAELTHTNMKIERVKQQDQTDVHNKQMAEKLEKEREKIEAQKKRVEKDVQKLRKQEEHRLKQMEQEAEKRMQKERKKIEEVYSRNAEEMERLEKMKQEAEEKMKAERERLEKQAEEARKNKEDAEKIRQNLESARNAMEEEAQKRELEQEEMRKKIESEAREKLEIERRKLAEQIAKNNQEVEQARREKAIAEAARVAAKEEAELMIEEYKSQHDKTREDEEQKIKEERLQLEQEQKKIRDALGDIQKARAEAETLKRAALIEITALKAEQLQGEITESDVAKAALSDKIKNAQDKLAMASEKAAKVDQEEEKVVVKQQVNKEVLQKTKAEEEALAKSLKEDLEGFKEELNEQEREFTSSKSQLDHMKRIKERALKAKKEAVDANNDLMSDISSQLGKKD